MTLEELQIILSVNNKQLIDGLNSAKKHLNSFNASTNKTTTGIFNSFKKMGLMIAGLGIGKMISNSIMNGMEAIESENLFEVSMGGFANEFREWSDELQSSLGLNAYEVRKNAALFHMLGTNMGISAETSAEMSKNLTQIAYDMASFRNKEPAQVFNALQSAMVGNTEALRSMGIVLTMAQIKQEAYRMGIAEVGDELNTTQKAMAIYSSICRQTALDQGDLARTINTPANQLRILRAQLQQLSIEFGKAFTPILTIVLPALNALVGKLIQVVKVVGQFMQALFGKSSSGGSGGNIGDVSGNLGDIAGGYDDIEQSAKKAKKQLMGFDEVNALNSEEPDLLPSMPGLGDMNIPGAEDIDTDTIPAKVQEMADKVRAVFQNFADWFARYKDIIISIIGGIATGFLVFQTLTFLSNIPAMLAGIGTALGALATPIGIASILIGGLAAVFIYLWRTNEEFRDNMKAIWDEIAGIFNDFWENTLKPFGEYFMGEFITPIAEAFSTYLLPVFQGVFEGIGQILVSILELITSLLSQMLETFKPGLDLIRDVFIDCFAMIKEKWDEHGQAIVDKAVEFIDNLKETLGHIWDEIFDPIIGNAIEMLRNLWDEHLKGMISSVADFVSKLIEGALDIYNEFIDPIVNWIVDTFGPAFVDTINYVIDVFGIFGGIIADVIGSILDVLGGLIDFIVGIFTGDWERAWDGIKQIFSGAWDGIKSIFGGFIEFFQRQWEWVKSFVGNIVKAIADTIVSLWKEWVRRVSELMDTIKEKISNVWNNIKDTIGRIVDNIKNVISNAWETVKNVTSNVMGKVGDIVGNVFEGIKKTINRICDFVSGGFKDAWRNAWNGVVRVFENVWNGITNFVKAPLNFIIDMVNKLINGLNRIRIPSWVPGIGGMGVNLPNIPRLAKGGIVNKPTLAEVGEAGPEMIVPLKNTDFVNKLANAVGRAVMVNMATLNSTTSQTESTPVIIQVNDIELGRASINSINKVTKMTGECPIRL